MQFAFIVATLVATSLAENIDPAAVLKCQANHANHKLGECEALIVLAKCFAVAHVDKAPATDSIRLLADQFLLGEQVKAPSCSAYQPIGKPEIRVRKGDLQFDVDGDNDVKLFRFRRETISLFDMSERVQNLEKANDGIPDKLAAVEQVANGVEKTANQNHKELLGAIADLSGTTDSNKDTAADDTADAAKDATDARAALKSALEGAISSGVASAKADSAKALTAQGDKNTIKFTALDAQIKAVKALADKAVASADANKKSLADSAGAMIIGWQQCEQIGENGADNSNYVAMACAYTKKRDDTIMYISVNSNQRQIGGNSRWRLRVNSNGKGFKDCSGPNNENTGAIYTRYHGHGSVDLHRPMFVGGHCYRTDDNSILKKGKVVVQWWQQDVSANSYWNWESSARMQLQEWMPKD